MLLFLLGQKVTRLGQRGLGEHRAFQVAQEDRVVHAFLPDQAVVVVQGAREDL